MSSVTGVTTVIKMVVTVTGKSVARYIFIYLYIFIFFNYI